MNKELEEKWEQEAQEIFEGECGCHNSNEPLLRERLKIWHGYGYLAACRKRQEEMEQLEGALNHIADPIGYLKSQLLPGYTLDGQMACRLSDDPNYLKGVAKNALKEAIWTKRLRRSRSD